MTGHETLGEAFARLGIKPMPPVEELKALTEEERRAAMDASRVSAGQFEHLPAWYREKLRRRAEETIARREAHTR